MEIERNSKKIIDYSLEKLGRREKLLKMEIERGI